MTLDTKPKFMNLNKQTQGSFRNCAYDFNTLPRRLTDIEDPKRYKKWLKIFIRNPTKLQNPLPTPEVEKANNLSEKLQKQMYPRIKTKLVHPPPDIPPHCCRLQPCLTNNLNISQSLKSQNELFLKILSELIPRCQNTLTIPEIDLNEMKIIIKNLKPTFSTGHDNINNKIK